MFSVSTLKNPVEVMSGIIKLHVSDPTKNNDKFGSYISYKITSQITRGGLVSPPMTTDRRYSDFSWLSGEFSREFPGIIVPPLPEKQPVGRFNHEFVESRRRALERFLKRVAAHSELSESELFSKFLQADDSAFHRFKESRASKRPKLGSSAIAWIEGTVQTLANGKPELEKSAADTKIDEISSYIFQLEKQMSSLLKHAEALVKKNRESSQVIFDLGQSLSLLGQMEGDSIGKGLNEVGLSLDSLSALTAAHAEAETIKFLETIDEYARMIGSIKIAVQQRETKKQSYLQTMIDLDSKQTSHRKLVGVPGKENQAKAKEQSFQVAQEAFDSCKLEFEKVTERLLVEFEVFKTQRALDMKEIMVDFITLQLEYNKKAEEQWLSLLPKLQLLSLEPNDSSALSPTNPVPPPPPSNPPPSAPDEEDR